MGLDGTAPRNEDAGRFNLSISHGFLNTLRAGFQGKYVALNIEAQLAGGAPEPAEVNVLTAVFHEIGRWLAELWEGRPLLGAEGKCHPSPDAPVALELIDELRADLVAFIPRLEEALAPGGDPASLVVGLGRQAYAREHHVKGLIEWGDRFGPETLADRYRQHLLPCQEDIRVAHHFLDRLREQELDAAGREELRDVALLLPSIFRARIHDMHLLIGQRRGAISFRLSGIERPEADVWKELGVGPEVAGYWRCYGFDPGTARGWLEAGFVQPAGAAAWRQRGFDVAEAVEWHNAGCNPRRALVLKRSSTSPAALEH